MIDKLLTEHPLGFLSLRGGCRGSSESTLVKMSNCWKSHAAARFVHQEIEMAAADQSEEGAIMKPTTVIKPLHKIISEHKDVLKIIFQLNSIISTFKSDIQEVLDLFSQYGHLWEKVSSMIIYSNTYVQR